MGATAERSPPSSASRWAPFISGAIGGTMGVLCTCPLEVVKTRLQSKTAIKGTGPTNFLMKSKVIACLYHIGKNEGARGLWRGLGPTLFGVIPHRAVYFSTYDNVKTAIEKTSIGKTPLLHLFSGLVAGLTATSVMNPVWLIKTRIQLQTNENPLAAMTNKSMINYANAFDAIKRIYAEEGPRGFYKGLSASYIGTFEGAIHFTLYEGQKRIWEEHFGTAPTYGHFFVMASISKSFACVAIYPHEVLRTRLREQRRPEEGKQHKYRSIPQMVRLIAQVHIPLQFLFDSFHIIY
eukprot:TRINITY_DN4514_c0_g1_i3.p1 TRINITY_DN4514_c0_g1~~TRINITY_DN4514_c0_g1_i3.p1  ORF type:complete len:293 (-),score=47.30 TRINITY_DN4514_c0_g1_i3:530-1408(-)